MKILKCTNHRSTPKQLAMGIIDPSDNDGELLRNAITYDELPTLEQINRTCQTIVNLVKKYGCDAAMLGGAPFLAGYEEEALFRCGLSVAFAFTKRIVKEEVLQDGSVKKTSLFDSSDTIIKHPDGTLEIIHAGSKS